MTQTNRRRFLLASAATLALAAPAFAQEIDLAALNAPPAIGEMEEGAPDAKVTVIEYASASCPHCGAFYNQVFPDFKKEYIDTKKVRFIFREFPHNDAGLAAFMIARSAPKEAYFGIIDALFKTQNVWLQDPRNGLLNIAKQAGFTEEKFNEILKDEALAKSILAVRDQAQKFGVDSIPTFFINGKKLQGEQTLAALKAEIDPLL
jgi:protein-disulfide isomerase